MHVMHDAQDPANAWKSRILSAVAELRFVEEETRQLKQDGDQLAAMIQKENAAIDKETHDLTARLRDAERELDRISEQCTAQAAAKVIVEREYQEALDKYDRLHDVVKLVKLKESECQQRHDYDKMLETESIAWAAEEHQLRTKLSALESQFREVKQKHRDEIAAAEGRLREAESRLHSDRMSRDASSVGYNRSHLHTSSAARPTTSLARQSAPRSQSVGQREGSHVSGAPAPILVNKSLSRKRDHFGDLTNH